jgi:DNA modification methylase
MTDLREISALFDCRKWLSPDGTVLLLQGDCLKLLPLLPDGCCDVCVTDPPYGHNNNNGDLIHRREEALGRGKAGAARAIANDGAEANEIYKDTLPHLFRLLKPGCCCCCCCGGGGGPDPQFARWSLWMDEVFSFKQMVVWDKGPMGMGWHYRRSYETVLVGEKPGAACHWHGGRKIENIIRPGAYGIRKIIPSECQHPCAKPVELYQHFIQIHTLPGDLVLDPFAGHAPCAEAAIRIGRDFMGVECDEEHFGEAIRRIEKAFEDRGDLSAADAKPNQQIGMFAETTP